MRKRSFATAVLLLACAVIANGCTIPLRIVVVNRTSSPAEVRLRFTTSETEHCEGPSWRYYLPASHVNRWIREADRRPADQLTFDEGGCSISGTIPAETALQLEYMVYPEPSTLDQASFSLDGAAGRVSLEGEQIQRHFDERSFGRFVFVYDAAQ